MTAAVTSGDFQVVAVFGPQVGAADLAMVSAAVGRAPAALEAEGGRARALFRFGTSRLASRQLAALTGLSCVASAWAVRPGAEPY